MRKAIFLIAMCILSLTAHSAVIEDTLYLNRDTVMMGNHLVNRCVLNHTSTFDKRNAHLDVEVGDLLELTIYNTDTVDHQFEVANLNTLGSIVAGGSATYSVFCGDFGTFGIKASDPIGDLLGAFAVLRVGLQNEQAFIWNLWEINDQFSHDVGDGLVTALPSTYRPNTNIINGMVYPTTTTDPLTVVTGNVGDTLYISVVNSGNFTHTLHSHGYHVKIVQATLRDDRVNWVKDSNPILKNETLTFQLIPDKPGMYPVHDHNLVSVLTQNTYPGGMITMLNIQP
ncbi:MAG: multicopper oxidase domain-containing protein [Crocinitomicaceae bacterium]